MTMTDVSCELCHHRMSKHKCGPENGQADCIECDCHLGPARRDDLLDEITDLKQSLNDMRCLIYKLTGSLEWLKQ